MFAQIVVALIVCLAVAASAAPMTASQIKEIVAADSKRVRTRSMNFKVDKAANKRMSKVQTSSTFVTTSVFSATDCTGTQVSVTYGSNLCLAITDASNGASSTQYTWDSSTSILSQAFYSDSACSTQTHTSTAIDFSAFTAGTCTSGILFDTATTYSYPTDEGLLSNLYTSSSTCSANTPWLATWSQYSADDDVLHIDDDLFTLTCFSETDSALFSDGDDDSTFTAVIYLTAGSTPMSGGGGGGGSSSSDSCFAGSESVMMESGEMRAISEIKVGDSILAADANGNAKFSTVIAVPHERNSKAATFTQIVGASGADIKMTPEHLVMVSESCDGSSKLMTASSVEAGMCLVSTSGMENVASVSSVSGNGIYSVVTNEEFVVVNGFVASPFAVNHAVSNAYYNVIRAVPSVMNFDVVKQANLLFGSLAESFSA